MLTFPRGQACKVPFLMVNVQTALPVPGQASNTIIYIKRDNGSITTATNANPTELDDTYMPGLYEVTLTASEMDCDVIRVYPINWSMFGQVFCQPIVIYTTTLGTSIAAIKSQTDKLQFDDVNAVYAYMGAGSMADFWNFNEGTINQGIGNRIKTNLNATVSSRAVPGDAMTLTTSERSSVASAVWSATTRTLTSFGTLVSDIWSHSTRTLTGFGTLVSDVAQAVWGFTVEASQSALVWMRLMGAVLFNKRIYSSGNVRYRDYNDTKDRIVGTEDQDGNRTITSLDGS